MTHIFKNNQSEKTLILLHGTGGDEYDLLELASRIDETANILSIRGNVKENNMNRFFKRIAVGVYDMDNYKQETNNLINAINRFSDKYQFPLENATIVGFSNGANIAIGLLQTNLIVKRYILFSPDFINPNATFKDLTGVKVFLTNAPNDPYVNRDHIKKLMTVLKPVLTVYQTAGHQITYEDLMASIAWYQE